MYAWQIFGEILNDKGTYDRYIFEWKKSEIQINILYREIYFCRNKSIFLFEITKHTENKKRKTLFLFCTLHCYFLKDFIFGSKYHLTFVNSTFWEPLNFIRTEY